MFAPIDIGRGVEPLRLFLNVCLFELVFRPNFSYIFSMKGMDGSQGHPVYKMVYEDERDPGALTASYMVALQITTVVNGEVKIIFDNPLANSPLSCR